MPAIARGQENQVDTINWFISLNGILTDAFAVEYQIWDITAGLPGSVIFPTPGDMNQWEVVTSGVGNFSTGSYYAYDNTNVQGWTPSLSEPIGTHRIKWRWKMIAASPYQLSQEDFEVLSITGTSFGDTYITIQDVRDEGLLEADYSDAKVLAAIETWQRILERICRQWFNARTIIFSIDGTDSDTIHFGVPIITVDYIKINNRTEELGTDYYRVYNGNTYPDDRKNPRIKLIGSNDSNSMSIYTRPVTCGKLRFIKGRQNQEIKATLGYVESDGSHPKAIERALLKLVIEKLTMPIYSTLGPSIPPVLGSILSEKTDGHSRRYGSPGGGFSERRPGLSGITQDPEILDIFKLYKAPIGIATPADWHY